MNQSVSINFLEAQKLLAGWQEDHRRLGSRTYEATRWCEEFAPEALAEIQHLRLEKMRLDGVVTQLCTSLGRNADAALDECCNSIQQMFAKYKWHTPMLGIDQGPIREKIKYAIAKQQAPLIAENERLRVMELERNQMLELTRSWHEHPEDWDGPCECMDCMRDAEPVEEGDAT